MHMFNYGVQMQALYKVTVIATKSTNLADSNAMSRAIVSYVRDHEAISDHTIAQHMTNEVKMIAYITAYDADIASTIYREVMQLFMDAEWTGEETIAQGVCMIRPDLIEAETFVSVGNTHILTEEKLFYQWAGDDDDEFFVLAHGSWKSAESIDFVFEPFDGEVYG